MEPRARGRSISNEANADAIRAWRSLPTAAATAELVGLFVFLAVVPPVNSRFPAQGSEAISAGLTALRDRWEAGHAIGFVLFALAFSLFVMVALQADGADKYRIGPYLHGSISCPLESPSARDLASCRQRPRRP